jgi:hypothetical protein
MKEVVEPQMRKAILIMRIVVKRKLGIELSELE